MFSFLLGVLKLTHKIGRWEYLYRYHGSKTTRVTCMQLPNGKYVRQDTMTDEQGKKYTQEEIDEINNKE